LGTTAVGEEIVDVTHDYLKKIFKKLDQLEDRIRESELKFEKELHTLKSEGVELKSAKATLEGKVAYLEAITRTFGIKSSCCCCAISFTFLQIHSDFLFDLAISTQNLP
jgi:hypothetical protein